MSDTKVSVWSKKEEDLTMGDQVKVAGVVVAVCTVVPIAVYGTIIGGSYLAGRVDHWWKSRKSEKTNSEKS